MVNGVSMPVTAAMIAERWRSASKMALANGSNPVAGHHGSQCDSREISWGHASPI